MHDEEKMRNFLESALARGDVQDGVVSNEMTKVKKIWQIRDLLPTARMHEKYFYKYDITLPLSRFYDIIPALREHLGDCVEEVHGFGHIGDSNLHVHIRASEFNEAVNKRIESFVYEYTAKLKGSISAEHGIGFAKKCHLEVVKQKEALGLMKQMKLMLDPNGILNPYKVVSN